MQALYNRLNQQYRLGDLVTQRDNLVFFDVEKDQLYSLAHQLCTQEGFTHLVILTAVDWLEDEQFQLTYLLHNRNLACDVGLRVRLPRDAAEMHSIHELWPTAATYQRELREMFGINFPQSPGVEHDFILEGWGDKPPYRRDFDTLSYSDATYKQREGRETHDPATHMKKKLYAEGGEK